MSYTDPESASKSERTSHLICEFRCCTDLSRDTCEPTRAVVLPLRHTRPGSRRPIKWSRVSSTSRLHATRRATARQVAEVHGLDGSFAAGSVRGAPRQTRRRTGLHSTPTPISTGSTQGRVGDSSARNTCGTAPRRRGLSAACTQGRCGPLVALVGGDHSPESHRKMGDRSAPIDGRYVRSLTIRWWVSPDRLRDLVTANPVTANPVAATARHGGAHRGPPEVTDHSKWRVEPPALPREVPTGIRALRSHPDRATPTPQGRHGRPALQQGRRHPRSTGGYGHVTHPSRTPAPSPPTHRRRTAHIRRRVRRRSALGLIVRLTAPRRGTRVEAWPISA